LWRLQIDPKNAATNDVTRPIFLEKSTKQRVNIIIIDTLRNARVFVSFTFPKPCENEVDDKIDAGGEESPSKLSHRVRFEKWRSNGAMNFKKNDADRSLYVLSIISVLMFVFSLQKKRLSSYSDSRIIQSQYCSLGII